MVKKKITAPNVPEKQTESFRDPSAPPGANKNNNSSEDENGGRKSGSFKNAKKKSTVTSAKPRKQKSERT
jgi:hypothetical protein